MDNNIMDRMENLRNYSDTIMQEVQKAKAPTFYKLNLEQKYSFEPHGEYNSLWEDNVLLYLINNLPYILNKKPHTTNDTLFNLVNNGIIQPFLLFVNKRFISWQDITIISDCKISYIMIKNIPEDTAIIDCILLPLTILYTENENYTDITDDDLFIFYDQKLVNKKDLDPAKVYTTIRFLSRQDLFYEDFDLIEYQRQKSSLDPKFKVNYNNLLLFQDGLLYDNSSTIFYGLNTFSINDNIFNFPIECKIFYYTKSNESLDNIENIINKDYLINQIVNNSDITSYTEGLLVPFDFTYDKTKTYDDNINNFLEYIMNYNSSYMDKVYNDTSNIISVSYTGQHINSLKDTDGNVKMSRRIDNTINNYVIIFKNGELYNYYYNLIYKNKDFIFPAIDIKDTDTIEMLFIKNIDNRVFKLFLNSDGDSTFFIGSVMDEDNAKLFSPDLPDPDYRISRTNHVEFEIDANFTKIDDDHIKIVPNYFYYDKDITLVSKRQFKYLHKLIKNETVHINLPQDFLYCNDPNNYLIFINNRKIDMENYKITVPKSTRPFDDMSVFVNITLNPNDTIDIFYIGEDFEEMILQPSIELNGDIFIDKSKLGYTFNKYLYLIFINGKKINSKDINNIDLNKIKIVNDQKSVKNLCIIKHIKNIDILNKLFSSDSDTFTKELNTLSDDELYKLFGNGVNMTNTENDIKGNTINMKSVLYQIINKYWLRPAVRTSDPFIYDYDITNDLDKDNAGNLLFPLDSNAQDYIQNDGDN